MERDTSLPNSRASSTLTSTASATTSSDDNELYNLALLAGFQMDYQVFRSVYFVVVLVLFTF